LLSGFFKLKHLTMKPIVISILLLFLVSTTAFGQIKIGDNPENIDPSSVLELESTSRVLVITRVSTAEMEAITPQRGGVVYNTDTQCVHYFNGTAWINLCEGEELNLTNDPIINTVRTISIVDNGTSINLEVAQNSIRSENIVDGGINGDDIQDNSIGESKLGADSVGASELRQNSVGSSEVVDGSIAPRDMANTIANQILTTDVNGIVIWSDAVNLQGALADEVTITGTGIPGDPLSLANAVQTAISDNTAAIIAETTRATNSEQANSNAIANEETRAVAAEQANIDAIAAETLRATAAETQNATDIASLQTDKEDVINKDDNTSLGTSDDAYPTQNAVKTYVDNELALVAAGSGTTELADQATITGDGSVGNEFTVIDAGITPIKIQPSPTTGQFLNTDAGGNVVWANIPAEETTELADQATITGDGSVGNEFTVTDAGITPIKIQPSPTTGQFLNTDAGGNVVWTNVPDSGTTELADQVTIVGNGQAGTEFTVRDAGITPIKIEPSLTTGQFLRTDAVGNVIWDNIPSSGSTEEADGTTITGVGTNMDPFKIEPGPDGQYLNTTGGVVTWANLPTGTGGTVQVDALTIEGNGSNSSFAPSIYGFPRSNI